MSIVGVVGRVLHRHHPRALLARLGVEEHVVQVDVQVLPSRYFSTVPRSARRRPPTVSAASASSDSAPGTFKLLISPTGRYSIATGSCVSVLTKRVAMMTHLVDLALEEEIPREGRNRARLRVGRRVAVREFGDELAPAPRDELRRLAAGRDERRRFRIEPRGEPEDVRVERAAQSLVGGDENDRALANRTHLEQRMREVRSPASSRCAACDTAGARTARPRAPPAAPCASSTPRPSASPW